MYAVTSYAYNTDAAVVSIATQQQTILACNELCSSWAYRKNMQQVQQQLTICNRVDIIFIPCVSIGNYCIECQN